MQEEYQPMSIGKRLLPLVALGAGLVVAVMLAWGPGDSSTETAFAHTGTGAAHLELDVITTNGAGPCDPVDTATSVFAGAVDYPVAVCIGDSDVAPISSLLNTVDVSVSYGAPLDIDDSASNASTDLDYATVDFDQIQTDDSEPNGVADDNDWDCNLSDVAAPPSAPNGSPSPARFTCAAAGGADNDLDTTGGTTRIATLLVDAPTPSGGPVVLDFAAGTSLTSGATETLCSDGPPDNCLPSTIEVLPAADLTLDKTCSPDPANAGDPVTCTLTITNNGPQTVPNVFVLDNLPDDKIYNDGASPDAPFCELVDIPALGLPGAFNLIACGSLGIGGNAAIGPLPAMGVVSLDIVYDTPLSAAGKVESDYAIVVGTVAPAFPATPFPDPDLTPLQVFLATNPPCNASPDPATCSIVALIGTTGPPSVPNCGAPLGLPSDNCASYDEQIAPADVTITKETTTPTVQQGDQASYTVTVDVGPGSPASAVTITDTVDANQSIFSAVMSVAGGCVIAPANPAPGNTATCTPAAPILPADPPVVVTIVADVLTADTDTTCDNDADVTFADPLTFSDSVSIQCVPPISGLQMVKTTDLEDPFGINDTVNLWLCDSPDVDGDGFQDDDPSQVANPACEAYDEPNGEVDNNGGGHLVVFERVFNATDPLGVGAFEFQLKFDHKIFDIKIQHGIDLNNDGDCSDNGETDDGIGVGDPSPTDCFLYTTGRIPNAPGGPGGCDMTIVTENFILFGCVSKENPDAIIPADGTPEDAEDCGNGVDDDGDNVDDDGCPIELGPKDLSMVAATIHIDPEDDLKFRLTPGQKNGVLRTILDENCELATIFGDPLEESVDGGLTEVCADLHVTTRILEGDLDLDCDVDVTDDQMIAFRYGAFFGNLLYDPWFDLEPSLKDFDVDIKDLQKVFGRNGSTCEDPIPDNQDPEPGGGFNGNPAPNPGP
jgi:uncharacterized repeat protein (TIGR01451 family)